MLHKKSLFKHSENEKSFFCATKMKTPFDNIVSHPKMHMCAQYGHIIINYAMDVAITLVICLESHETSYVIALFENTLFKYLQYSKFVIFHGN